MTKIYFYCEWNNNINDDGYIQLNLKFIISPKGERLQEIQLRKDLKEYKDNDFGLALKLNDEVKVCPINTLFQGFQTSMTKHF